MSSAHFAIVASKFNVDIVDRLLEGARAAFQSQAVADDHVLIVRVPGAFEVPLLAKKLAQSGKYAAIVCLGVVIRGDTDHYDHVASAARDGILRASLDTGVPMSFGVLTCDTEEQALDRAGGKEGNKGYDAAITAIEMANLFSRLE